MIRDNAAKADSCQMMKSLVCHTKESRLCPRAGGHLDRKNIQTVTLVEGVGDVVRGAMTENRGLPHPL